MTDFANHNGLTREHRETFARLADVLVPRLGEMPAANEVDISGQCLERVLGARPDLAGRLADILENAGGADPEATVLRLEREAPEDLAALLTAVAAGYYMSDEVRSLLGYAGQRAIRADTDEQLEALTRPVIERGPIHRKA